MVSKCAGSIAVDYHVQGAMLEAYRKLKTKPKTIAELKESLQVISVSYTHLTLPTNREV